MGHDVFISHSSHDKRAAKTICARLEHLGIRCWLAPRDIRPGGYATSIMDGISNARIMVVLLSSGANASRHVMREVERAISRGLTIVPFRIEDVAPLADLEYFLSTEHWLDAHSPPLEAHVEELAEYIRPMLHEPARERVSESAQDRRAQIAMFEEITPDEWSHARTSGLRQWLGKLLQERD